MFTKGEIFKMKEAEFQNSVLISLFRAMGFNDVTPFGGGSLERGKDIVMWKNSELGQRLNFGVVVKAKKITGNAETNEGAMNVLNQVRQMLKTKYINPVSGDNEEIKRCFVACSKDINKEAMNSIEGELQNDLNKLIEWIHPLTNLFDLIEKYLPEKSVAEKLSEARSALDKKTALIPYRIVADTDNIYQIIPKHSRAFEEMPLTINAKFKFDIETPEGKEAQQKIEEHIKKGTPVEIQGEFIESIELPSFLSDIVDLQMSKDSRLVFKQIPSDYEIPLFFERHLSNGEVIKTDSIFFQKLYHGEDEITLRNKTENSPLQITITVEPKSKKARFDFSYRYFGFNVYTHLKSLTFFTSMVDDGETAIYRADTGQRVARQKIKAESADKFDKYKKALEAFVLIQEKTSVLLTLDEDKFRKQNMNDVFQVAGIVRNGKLEVTLYETHTEIPLNNAKKMISSFGNEAINYIVITYPDSWNYEILGKEIVLGNIALQSNYFISNNNCKKAEKDIEANKEMVDFVLTPKEDLSFIEFLQWNGEDVNEQ